MLQTLLTKTFPEITDGNVFLCSILIGGMDTYTDVSMDYIFPSKNLDTTLLYLRVTEKVLLKMEFAEIFAIAKTSNGKHNVFVQALDVVIALLNAKYLNKLGDKNV